jgi:glycosyltransferase involved in cell wall biosynthesis
VNELDSLNVLEVDVVAPGCGELPQVPAGKPLVSVVITTKNRREELSYAIRSALSQAIPVEVLVIDDGSTDGTAEMVRAKFPSVRLERSATSMGYVEQRNRGARLATGDIIFSIDDDAFFTSPRIVAQTLAEFDHPRVGAVAIPYVEPNKSAMVHQHAPSKDGIFVTDSFIGTAHAVRKNLFLRVGGYRDVLVHQGEEMDFCIRMLDIGYVVRLGSADPVHHMESPRRDFGRMDYYGHRNNILFVWHNVPMPYLPFHLLATTVNGFTWAIRGRRFRKTMLGIASGYFECFRRGMNRRPVPRGIYRLHRVLKKNGPQLLSNIAVSLPPVDTSNGFQSSQVASS